MKAIWGDYVGAFFKAGSWGFRISQNKMNWLNRELEEGGDILEHTEMNKSSNFFHFIIRNLFLRESEDSKLEKKGTVILFLKLCMKIIFKGTRFDKI